MWSIFVRVRQSLESSGLITRHDMYSALAEEIAAAKSSPYDHAVIDEAQDISVSQLRFFAALGGGKAYGLFFTGDLGQRIFQQIFSWKSLGVEIQGRSHTLRVNYRTSHQIRVHADRLIDRVCSDGDGNREDRSDTISVFNGF